MTLADLVGITYAQDHTQVFVAALAISVACGLVGYFLVLRAQVFAADALSHAAFTGALAALAVGLDARIGLFVTVFAVASLVGALGPRSRRDDVVIGAVFAWLLGLGALFLALYTTGRSARQSTAGVATLFGSVSSLTGARATVATAVAVLIVVSVVVVARPLLHASVDESVAAARGVPVRLLGIGFLVIVGLTAAEATQSVGAMLLLGLVAAPAATARRVTAMPYVGLAASATVAAVVTWTGLVISYRLDRVPPSFAIVATLSATYAVVYAVVSLLDVIKRRARSSASPRARLRLRPLRGASPTSSSAGSARP